MYKFLCTVKRCLYWGRKMRNRPFWDYAFLLLTMADFLEGMQNELAKNKRHIGYEKKVKQILICKNLCRQIVDDNYNAQWKWGAESDSIRKRMKKEESMRNRDLDMLFTMMRKRILRWWD